MPLSRFFLKTPKELAKAREPLSDHRGAVEGSPEAARQRREWHQKSGVSEHLHAWLGESRGWERLLR